jgi:hypothetical protein
MGMREIRVYEGDFPTFEQMLAGGLAAAFPKEVWLPQVQLGEFAVRYKDFKSGLARNPTGKPVQSSEICRVFGSLEEARANSRQVATEHWTVRCFIYDHTGSQVDTISNNKEASKFAVVLYAGILLWVGIFAVIGMGLIWMLSKITLLILGPFPSVHELFSRFGWLGWTVYAFAGLLVGVLAWFLRIRFIANKRMDLIKDKLTSVISAEERKRFEEVNTLYGSRDPAERERFLKLAAEYRDKVTKALKK